MIRGFKRKPIGANEYLIQFQFGGGVEAVKLKEIASSWACVPDYPEDGLSGTPTAAASSSPGVPEAPPNSPVPDMARRSYEDVRLSDAEARRTLVREAMAQSIISPPPPPFELTVCGGEHPNLLLPAEWDGVVMTVPHPGAVVGKEGLGQISQAVLLQLGMPPDPAVYLLVFDDGAPPACALTLSAAASAAATTSSANSANSANSASSNLIFAVPPLNRLRRVVRASQSRRPGRRLHQARQALQGQALPAQLERAVLALPRVVRMAVAAPLTVQTEPGPRPWCIITVIHRLSFVLRARHILAATALATTALALAFRAVSSSTVTYVCSQAACSASVCRIDSRAR